MSDDEKPPGTKATTPPDDMLDLSDPALAIHRAPIASPAGITWMTGSAGATGAAGPLGPIQTDLQSGVESWSEHFHYDVDMLYEIEALWAEKPRLAQRLTERLASKLHNALIEAFLIHERNIAEFFREKKTDERHYHVSDFLGGVPQAMIWRAKRIPKEQGDRLEAIFTFASIHLAHPSRLRTHDKKRKQVNINDDVRFLGEIIRTFLNSKGVAARLSRRVDWSLWIS